MANSRKPTKWIQVVTDTWRKNKSRVGYKFKNALKDAKLIYKKQIGGEDSNKEAGTESVDEVAPEATTEATPEAAPEATPEATPVAAANMMGGKRSLSRRKIRKTRKNKKSRSRKNR